MSGKEYIDILMPASFNLVASPGDVRVTFIIFCFGPIQKSETRRSGYALSKAALATPGAKRSKGTLLTTSVIRALRSGGSWTFSLTILSKSWDISKSLSTSLVSVQCTL